MNWLFIVIQQIFFVNYSILPPACCWCTSIYYIMILIGYCLCVACVPTSVHFLVHSIVGTNLLLWVLSYLVLISLRMVTNWNRQEPDNIIYIYIYIYISIICAYVGTKRLLSFTMHRENNTKITLSELNCRFCICVGCSDVYFNVWQGCPVFMLSFWFMFRHWGFGR